mgnify:CR=1 FL=1
MHQPTANLAIAICKYLGFNLFDKNNLQALAFNGAISYTILLYILMAYLEEHLILPTLAYSKLSILLDLVILNYPFFPCLNY